MLSVFCLRTGMKASRSRWHKAPCLMQKEDVKRRRSVRKFSWTMQRPSTREQVFQNNVRHSESVKYNSRIQSFPVQFLHSVFHPEISWAWIREGEYRGIKIKGKARIFCSLKTSDFFSLPDGAPAMMVVFLRQNMILQNEREPEGWRGLENSRAKMQKPWMDPNAVQTIALLNRMQKLYSE